MVKKRLIFTLLYDSGSFMLSRNFRLQRVGDIDWLNKNYNFSRIAGFIDELVVLDVTRGSRDIAKFCDVLKKLSLGCFVPIAAGGGVRSVDDASLLLQSGADKVVVNTPLFDDKDLVKELASKFGQQCLIGSVDVLGSTGEGFAVVTASGTRKLDGSASDLLKVITGEPIGELYLNSIDKDGTGQGYDFALLDLVPENCNMPVILAGGVGNVEHLIAGFVNSRVDAAATANLFNFIGNGLQLAREGVLAEGHKLATWPDFDQLSLKKAIV